MSTIIGISGSLRRASYNTALLHAARACAPATTTFQIESIAEIPLYNLDIEERAFPAAVARLKDVLAASDGLLMVTPEYNNSLPGVFKNAIDWLTRPGEDIARVFGGLHVAVIGASSGRFATSLAQVAWLPVLRQLQCTPWFEERLLVGNAADAFNAAGALTDPATTRHLERFMRDFTTFVEHNPRKRR